MTQYKTFEDILSGVKIIDYSEAFGHTEEACWILYDGVSFIISDYEVSGAFIQGSGYFFFYSEVVKDEPEESGGSFNQDDESDGDLTDVILGADEADCELRAFPALQGIIAALPALAQDIKEKCVNHPEYHAYSSRIYPEGTGSV